jgi:hypothetical protein
MVINAQVLSNKQPVDFVFTSGEIAALVEVKTSGGSPVTSWWVAGPTRLGSTVLLLHMQIALTGETDMDVFEECKKHAKKIIDLSKVSALAGGLREPALSTDAATREMLADMMLKVLGSLNRADASNSLAKSTAQNYELAKSFDITKVVEFVARFEQVPVTTIQRRLASARDSGFIQKQRNRR